MQEFELPARTGRAVEVPRGGAIRVVNTYGSQVVDTWAVRRDTQRRLSMSHTHVALGRVLVRVPDRLVDDHREPMVALEDDTSPGVHDTLVPACDPARYAQLGHVGEHANCSDNFRSALGALGIDLPGPVPAPLNLFMQVGIGLDGRLVFLPPASRPGDAVSLRALTDVVFVLSACPQDLVPVNGEQMRPRPVNVQVYAPDESVGAADRP